MDSLRHRVSSILSEDLTLMLEEELTVHAQAITQLEEKIADTKGVGNQIRREWLTSLGDRKNEARRLRARTRRGPTAGNSEIEPVVTRNQKVAPYTGEPQDWPRYREEVDCLIIRSNMSPQAKMIELRRSLGGDRHKLFANFVGTNVNFDDAIQLLDETYGGEDNLLSSLKDRIEATRSLQYTSSLEDWQHLVELAIELQSLPNVNHEYGKRQLIEKIVERLPFNDHCRLSKIENIGIEMVVEEVRHCMRAVNKIRNRTRERDWPHPRKQAEPLMKRARREPSPRKGSTTRPAYQRSSFSDVCKACGKQGHPLWICDAESAKIRRTAANANLCFRCLQHPYSLQHFDACRRTCIRCQGAHATVLHESATKQRTDVQRAAVAKEIKRETAALPSIMVDIMGTDGLIRTRMGIDTYSTFNTVDEGLIYRTKLSIENDGDGPLSLIAFESDRVVTLSGDYVKLPLMHIMKSGDPIVIKAYITKKKQPYVDFIQPAHMRRELGSMHIDVIDPVGPVELFVGASDYFHKINDTNKATPKVAVTSSPHLLSWDIFQSHHRIIPKYSQLYRDP